MSRWRPLTLRGAYIPIAPKDGYKEAERLLKQRPFEPEAVNTDVGTSAYAYPNTYYRACNYLI